MELKKEDFKLYLDINNRKFLALRYDYFDKVVEEVIKEVIEEVIPEPTKEELAEIKKQKLIEKKKAELSKLLEE